LLLDNSSLQQPQGFIEKDTAFFYGLHLADPHHFFATEQAIFMHNFEMAIPLVSMPLSTLTAGATAASVAAGAVVVACALGFAAVSIASDIAAKKDARDAICRN
jgi:hypothetical protein